MFSWLFLTFLFCSLINDFYIKAWIGTNVAFRCKIFHKQVILDWIDFFSSRLTVEIRCILGSVHLNILLFYEILINFYKTDYIIYFILKISYEFEIWVCLLLISTKKKKKHKIDHSHTCTPHGSTGGRYFFTPYRKHSFNNLNEIQPLFSSIWISPLLYFL